MQKTYRDKATVRQGKTQAGTGTISTVPQNGRYGGKTKTSQRHTRTGSNGRTISSANSTYIVQKFTLIYTINLCWATPVLSTVAQSTLNEKPLT